MPINDNPIANREDGSPIYDNAPTVGAVALIIDGKVLAIRRNNEPGKGKIGLPAGYHMRGETWKEGLARELFEETGCQINPAHLRQATELYTDEYGNNMVFAVYLANPDQDQPAFDVAFQKPDEVQEVLYLEVLGEPETWAFPLHYEFAARIKAADNLHKGIMNS
jgi:ADP-ribose pyrophosphatase YjhB (NUDIX family)